MLQKIRHTTNSITFRILLGLLVMSFAIWGVSDVLKGTTSKVVATFDNINPITYEDFARARAIQIKQMQQNSEQPLSDEQIKVMGIEQAVMQDLITNKLFEYLAYKFDVDFSNKVIADFIRKLTIFKDDNNEFDIDKFKSFLRSQHFSEDEYSENVRNVLSRDIIMSSLVGNAYIPQSRVNNIISYMSEKRVVEVASISLSPKANKTQKVKFKEEDLLNFYKENSALFKTDEARDICYAKLNIKTAMASITVSDAELNSYFNENKDEFLKKKFDKVKDIINAKLKKQKAEEWIMSTSKALGDEVAGGATLQEIADKYKLQKVCEKNISTNNIETRAGGLFTNYITEISELEEKEMSYPLDLPKGEGQILIEIAKLEPEQVKPFEQVQNKVSDAYASFLDKQQLLKKLQDFAESSNDVTFAKDAAAIGMVVSPAKDYIRASLTLQSAFPTEMLVNMFAASKGKVMGPFITDDNAYVFIVKNIGYDNKTKEKITKDSVDNIANKLREGIFEELMIHTTNASNVKVNASLGGE